MGYCVSVTKEHVKDAYRLLNKSIIRVEEPDIDLEDMDNELAMDDANTQEQSQETQQTEMSAAELAEAAIQKKKISITFESYKAISNLIVMYLRRQEALDETESSRKSALINWYLNEISDEIETEEELTEKKLMVERVINRLIYQVCRIFPSSSSCYSSAIR